jgi:predicted nucleotidyltransferase
MLGEKREPRNEQREKITNVPPAMESFLHPREVSSAWLKPLMKDVKFVAQLESRLQLNERLDAVLSHLSRPDVSLQQAVLEGEVMEKQAADLFTSLSALLEDGSDYERIILYFPFELLPNVTWKPASAELASSAQRFREAYMQAWNDLLFSHDVRANFVDGDVLDVESRKGDVPRVVKAAHLIPKLIENGFLDMEDVFELLETTEDDVLRQSIADTLPVLADEGVLREFMLVRLESINDTHVRDVAAKLSFSSKKEPERMPMEKNLVTAAKIQRKLSSDFAEIDAETYSDVTNNRAVWLRKEAKRKAIESVGDVLGIAMIDDAMGDDVVEQLIADDEDLSGKLAFVEGVRGAIESSAQHDQQRAQELYEKYREALLALWKQDAPEVREALQKTFCRLHGLSLVADEQLHVLGIAVPDLGGSFSENAKGMQKELLEIKGAIASLEKNAELSKLIYPLVLVFGSRVKGYGTGSSDIDLAIFVKPGTAPSEHVKIQAGLRQLFPYEKIGGDVVQFWLKKTDAGLCVDDDTGVHDLYIGQSEWVHELFLSLWEGDAELVNTMRQQLLIPYLAEQEKKIHGRDARRMYIEQLERDLLQYRLMHKGYERFFPTFGGVHAPHADQIDGKSMFWDSGYRQTATRLFARSVFLPKASRSY